MAAKRKAGKELNQESKMIRITTSLEGIFKVTMICRYCWRYEEKWCDSERIH